MVELPESYSIAKQFDKHIAGRKITSCVRGNSPHKFAFYNHEPEEYAKLAVGTTVDKSTFQHCFILSRLSNGLILSLGEGGEKIILHNSSAEIPKKHHLLIGFDDGRYLSVVISGWGMVSLFTPEEIAKHPYLAKKRTSSFDKSFTVEKLDQMVKSTKGNDSVKYFLISEPGIDGVGNGMCQEILFDAGLHPKAKMKDFNTEKTERLHQALVTTLKKACELGGRDTEVDIFGSPGGFATRMTTKTAGTSCPKCGDTIQKISWLGGNCYFCPTCQEL